MKYCCFLNDEINKIICFTQVIIHPESLQPGTHTNTHTVTHLLLQHFNRLILMCLFGYNKFTHVSNEIATAKLTNKGRLQINSDILIWELGQLNTKQSVAKNNHLHSITCRLHTFTLHEVTMMSVYNGELK